MYMRPCQNRRVCGCASSLFIVPTIRKGVTMSHTRKYQGDSGGGRRMGKARAGTFAVGIYGERCIRQLSLSVLRNRSFEEFRWTLA